MDPTIIPLRRSRCAVAGGDRLRVECSATSLKGGGVREGGFADAPLANVFESEYVRLTTLRGQRQTAFPAVLSSFNKFEPTSALCASAASGRLHVVSSRHARMIGDPLDHSRPKPANAGGGMSTTSYALPARVLIVGTGLW